MNKRRDVVPTKGGRHAARQLSAAVEAASARRDDVFTLQTSPLKDATPSTSEVNQVESQLTIHNPEALQKLQKLPCKKSSLVFTSRVLFLHIGF